MLWDFLLSELRAVEHELADCRDYSDNDNWKDICQNLMLANTGMNIAGFADYVIFSTNYLMQQFTSGLHTKEENNYFHFNFRKLQYLTEELDNHKDFTENLQTVERLEQLLQTASYINKIVAENFAD